MAISRIARLGIEIDTSKVPAAERRINNLGDSGRTAGKAMKGLAIAAAAVVTSLAVRKLIDAADAYTNINNRLKQATTSAEAFAKAQDDVGQIAQRTFSDIEGVTVLYARLGRQSGELGITQQQVARTTETITKAIQLSGASAQEASGAVRQLAQGLAAGALRGEEFNSVAENAPRLLEILKTELGATTGELRAMAAEGELTSERIIAAFENQSEAIDREFKSFTPTVSAGLETINSGFIELAGAINDATGASKVLADVFLQIGGGASEAARRIREATSESSKLLEIEEKLSIAAANRFDIVLGLRQAEADGNRLRQRELQISLDAADKLIASLIEQRDLLNDNVAAEAAAEAEARAAEAAEASAERSMDAYREYYRARSVAALEAADIEDEVNQRDVQTRDFAGEDALNQRRFVLEGERQALEEFDDFYRNLLGDQLEYDRSIYAQKLDARRNSLAGEMQAIEDFYAEQDRLRQENVRASGQAASAIGGFFVQQAQNKATLLREELRNTEDMTEGEIAARERAAKAAFENAKDLQKGLVVINTAAAVMNELATNPNPFAKWLTVTAIVATGATQLSKINSQSFGSIGSVDSSTNGGGNGSQGSAADIPVPESEGPMLPPTQVNVAINGATVSREGVIELINEINQAVGDGARIRVTQ